MSEISCNLNDREEPLSEFQIITNGSPPVSFMADDINIQERQLSTNIENTNEKNPVQEYYINVIDVSIVSQSSDQPEAILVHNFELDTNQEVSSLVEANSLQTPNSLVEFQNEASEESVLIKRNKPGPTFHGLKGKPTGMGLIFKKRRDQNLFSNLAEFAKRNECELLSKETKVDDRYDDLEILDTDKDEDEIKILKDECLKTKVSVQLDQIDFNNLPGNIKIKVCPESDIEIPENLKKLMSKFGKYGKKKKQKVSDKLLREIDKTRAKRFKKVSVAEAMWKKIQKMEKTGVNLKLREGRKPIKGKFPCDSCDYVANQKSHLVAHKSVHARKFMKCKYCKYESRSESKMMEHEARHTGDKPFVCTHEGCDYAGVCKGDLTKHQRKHQTNKPYKCPHCDFSTKWPRNIRSHLLTHTDERPHKCKLCGFGFKRGCDLKYHMYRHSDSKPIKCYQCDFRCKTNFEIKCHMLKHSDVRYFKCPHPGCKQETKTKSDLTKHMKVHCKSLDFVCDLCGKGFKTKSSLRKHILRHSEERPWKCDICGKGFKLKPALRYHINMHANYKPHSCEICGMLFGSLGNKRTHMVVHSSKDRPLKCPICPYLGKTQDHILSHIGTMHGSQYAYFCEICKKPFKRYHLLQVHYPRCHTKEEIAFMESVLQLNVQAIKSEVINEISSAELAKKNAELNWDCIIVRDERGEDLAVDKKNFTNADKNTSDIGAGSIEELCEKDDAEHDNPESQDHPNNRSIDVNVDVNTLDERKDDTECTKLENLDDSCEASVNTNTSNKSNEECVVEIPKKENLDNSFEPPKPATIAIYDGFRLPLATIGFHFNFIKKGKKTNAWFMDSKLMDETARERHLKYLSKKKAEVLYGYYNSKRRRRGNEKLTNVLVEKPKKGEINKASNSMRRTKLSKVMKQSSNNLQVLDHLLPNVINTSTKESHKTTKKAYAIPSPGNHMNATDVKNIEDNIPLLKMVKPRGRPGRKPKVCDNSVTEGITVVKPTGKQKSTCTNSQNLEINERRYATELEKANSFTRKSKNPSKNVAKTTGKSKIVNASTSKLTTLKGKRGRKPKSVLSQVINVKGKPGRKSKGLIPQLDVSETVQLTKSSKQGKTPKTLSKVKKLKDKQERKTKVNTIVLTKTQKNAKGKAGKKPKMKQNMVSIKHLIAKGKPGRKPKVRQLCPEIRSIKQEKMDEFDKITASIDDLLKGQGDVGEPSGQVDVGQDFGQSCDLYEDGPSSSGRIDSKKRKRNHKVGQNSQTKKKIKFNQEMLANKSSNDNTKVLMTNRGDNNEKVNPNKSMKIKYNYRGKTKNAKETHLRGSAPKKRGPKKKQPEVLIENAEDTSSQVYPVCLQENFRNFSELESDVVIKEEVTVELSELDQGDILEKDNSHEKYTSETNITHQTRENHADAEVNGSETIIQFCDDVIAMRSSTDFRNMNDIVINENEPGLYDKNLNARQPSSVDYLGIQIQNVHGSSAGSVNPLVLDLERPTDNVIVQTVETGDDTTDANGRITNKLDDVTTDELLFVNSTEDSDVSSPVKEEQIVL